MDSEMEALAMRMLAPVRLVRADFPGEEFVGGMVSSSSVGMQRSEESRVPQWSLAETREFIAIRADLERDFTQAKRNKALWEAVAARMAERGFRRTPEQCKCKWKNLVNRYKGKETSNPENAKQCPFFDELHSIFTERAKNMQRLLLESELRGVTMKRQMKRTPQERSVDDFSLIEEDDDDVDDDDDDDSEEQSIGRKGKKRKLYKEKARVIGDKPRQNTLESILQIFLQQQHMLEIQWREMAERRAQERLLFEQEWRRSIEKRERERLIMEQSWRDREEKRRVREETHAEKRDALLTALLKKLIDANF